MMKWFKRSANRTCDWCGVGFDGDGVETADGLLLCGAACSEAKSAPPLEGPRRRRNGRRVRSGGAPDYSQYTLVDAAAHVAEARAFAPVVRALIDAAHHRMLRVDHGDAQVLDLTASVSAHCEEAWYHIGEALEIVRYHSGGEEVLGADSLECALRRVGLDPYELVPDADASIESAVRTLTWNLRKLAQARLRNERKHR